MSYEEFNGSQDSESNIKALSKFNWGAYGFGVIWALFNGAFLKAPGVFLSMLLAYAFCFIFGGFFELIFLIALFCLSIHAGRNGNIWAWDGKYWNDFNHFEKVQRIWATVWGVMIALIALFIICDVMSYTNELKKISAEIQTEGGAEKFTNRILVKQIVKTPGALKARSGAELVKIIGKGQPTYGEDGVLVQRPGKEGGDIVMQFYKEDSPCSLAKGNCYVIFNLKNKRLEPKVKTYYDNKGKTRDVLLQVSKTK